MDIRRILHDRFVLHNNDDGHYPNFDPKTGLHKSFPEQNPPRNPKTGSITKSKSKRPTPEQELAFYENLIVSL